VEYDTRSLEQIIEKLLTEHTFFDQQTRAALIDDNLNLAFAGWWQMRIFKMFFVPLVYIMGLGCTL